MDRKIPSHFILVLCLKPVFLEVDNLETLLFVASRVFFVQLKLKVRQLFSTKPAMFLRNWVTFICLAFVFSSVTCTTKIPGKLQCFNSYFFIAISGLKVQLPIVLR